MNDYYVNDIAKQRVSDLIQTRRSQELARQLRSRHDPRVAGNRHRFARWLRGLADRIEPRRQHGLTRSSRPVEDPMPSGS